MADVVEKLLKLIVEYGSRGEENIGKGVKRVEAALKQIPKIEAEAFGGEQITPYFQKLSSKYEEALSVIPGVTYEALKKADEPVKTSRRQWFMFGMSIMWFGYTLRRTVEGFGRSSLDTFMKVTGAENEFHRGIVHLSAAWEYFKFSFINTVLAPILMPLIPIILQIIDSVVDFINQNQAVATALGWAFIFVAILGSVFWWLGQIIVLVSGVAGPLGGLFATISGFITGTLLPIIGSLIGMLSGPLIAAIILFALIWIFNIGNIHKTFAIMFKYLGDAFDNLMEIVGNFFGLFGDLLGGNWGAVQEHATNILKLFGQLFLNLMGAITALATGFWNVFFDIAKLIAKTVTSIFIDMVNGLMDIFRGFYSSFYNMLPKELRGMYAPPEQFGVKLSKESAMTAIDKAAQSMTDASDLINNAFKVFSDYLTTTYLTTTYTHEEANKKVQKTGETMSETDKIMQQYRNSVNLTTPQIDVLAASSTSTATAFDELKKKTEDYSKTLTTATQQLAPAGAAAGVDHGGVMYSMAQLAHIAAVGRSQGIGEVAYSYGPGGGYGITTGAVPPGATALQGGGLITRSGLFMLHRGEAVSPANQVSYGGITVNVNNPVVRETQDIDELTRQIGEKIREEMVRRVSM